MDNIKNKTVLITGAASGIGFWYAKKMLTHGAKAVAILDLSSSPGQTSAANLEKEFGKGKAVFYPCDVTDTNKFEETFKKVWNAFNGLDIIINNAGILNDKEWHKTINLNVGGVIQGSLLALDYMGKHKGGKGGTIVNIASIVGFQLFPAAPVYCASKYSVLAFSRCIETKYETTGVRVLVMCPGVTETPLIHNARNNVLDMYDPEEVIEQLRKFPRQPSEHVADTMVTLIQKGKNGAIWVSENSQPPHALEFPPAKKVAVDLRNC